MTGSKKYGMIFRGIFLLFILYSCAVWTGASDTVGEVLYHQDFSVISSAQAAGVAAGAANTSGGEVAVRDAALAVRGHDAYRVYAILPEICDLPDNYTFEATFRFDPRDEGAVENGYISFLMSCTGETLSDVLGFRIRANGDVEVENTKQQKEGLGVLSDALLAKMTAGETVRVIIPVKGNDIRGITFISGEESCSIHRNEDLALVPDSRLGFCVRNAYVSVEEVWIVNGTDYAEKTGALVSSSYADDGGIGEPDEPYAPPTGDMTWLWACLAVSGVYLIVKRRYCRPG